MINKNDGFTLIELLVTLVIVGVIMTFIISMMSSQYAIIRDVDAYLTISSENKDVNDALIQEFAKAETFWIDSDNNGVFEDDEKVSNGDFSTSDTNIGISALAAEHELTDIQLGYTEGTNNVKVMFVKKDDPINGTKSNELYLKKSIGGTTSLSTPALGVHLSTESIYEPTVTFYSRLSLDRRVVALTKVKINYTHDGITKPYDLFYHLRNLDYSN